MAGSNKEKSFFANLIPKIDIAKSYKKRTRNNSIYEDLSDDELVEKLAEEEERRNQEINRRTSKLKAYVTENRIPSPPIIKHTNDALLLSSFVEKNDVRFDDMSLFDAINYVIDKDELSHLSLRVDDEQELIFTPNGSGFPTVVLKAGSDETVLLNPDVDVFVFLDTVKGYAEKSNITENKKDVCSYKTIPTDYREIIDEKKRIGRINEIYLQLAENGLYEKTQLKMLYNLMFCNYDINCFASPLYTYEQLEILTFLYENNESPEYENFLKDFTEFCTNNFKYKFTNSEFMTLFDAAVDNRLKDLITNPNFEANFRLLYYFDTAACTDKENPKEVRIELGGNTFIATSQEYKENGDLRVVNKLYIEGIDSNGNLQKEEIYSDINGVQSGDLSLYINAYNKKHQRSDAVDTRTLFVKFMEEKLDIVSKTNSIQELKLKNDETLLFKKKMFMDNGEKQFAPCIYLKDINGEIKKKFVDVKSTLGDDGRITPVFIQNVEELLDYIERVGFKVE